MSAHRHNHEISDRASLKWAISLNLIITIAQVIGGLWVSSMALITDALHNFMDVAALIISLVAIYYSKMPFSIERSFGYKRAETFAAMINSVAIVIVALIILVESFRRLIYFDQGHIQGMVVVWLAALAIVINGFSAWLVHKGSKGSMNMRSAFLHLLSDTLFSLAVLIGGLFMHYKGVYWLDAVLSIVIAIYLIFSSWPLITKSFNIIMQFSPAHIDLKEVQIEIEKIDGVINIHHVHIWELDERNVHLEGHVEVEENIDLPTICKILDSIESLLKQKFNISHVTLQPESGRCEDPKLVGH